MCIRDRRTLNTRFKDTNISAGINRTDTNCKFENLQTAKQHLLYNIKTIFLEVDTMTYLFYS